MSEIEINGFDEAGIIGKNLRFVRVGIDSENQLRPFVYNLLHFGSVTTSKKRLAGFADSIKKEYVLKIREDPAISVDHYNFPTEHQLDVLRQFTLLEHMNLYKLRGNLIRYMSTREETELTQTTDYLKRYARTPPFYGVVHKSIRLQNHC